MDDQEHDSRERQCAEEESRSRHMVDQQPNGYTCYYVNGCWKEAVEVGISIQITSAQRETKIGKDNWSPAEIQHNEKECVTKL